ncbi:hypothetical protein L585_20165 [Pantoea ananatis BRT175]|uniref:phage tail assembly chaperone n=1 Tax=Pantoea ananas TaxID=553 RepID=UPI0003B20EE7|nr:hypothetical protein [Pantoea ananatis]ERM12573.1 hypothetical protein L585_20165 [Pantoea ananatis BRT175]
MEFQIKGIDYRTSKLNVFEQLKVSRKLLPVLAGLLAEYGSIRDMIPKKGGTDADPESYGAILEKVLPKVADQLAALSEEDTNAIIFPCLSAVSRRQDKNSWVPVVRQNELMFDDIDLLSMLQMVGRVVGDSLGNFLPALPDKETPPPPAV